MFLCREVYLLLLSFIFLQLNQSAVMNLLNGQGVLNNGLVSSGQNILVNGQVVNIGQLGGLAIQQQLQLQQQQQQSGVSLGQTVVSRPVARQLQQQQQLQNQSSPQQQLFLSQNTANGVGVIGNNQQQQQLSAQILLQQQQKVAVGLGGTPLTNIQQGNFRAGGSQTPNNTGSNCSTPAPTPTPSTPTPTPTPDLMLDPNCSSSGKGGQTSNILEQALTMSQIDLQSFEDDFNLLGGADDCIPSAPAAPAPEVIPVTPKPKPKRQSKKSKAVAQQQQQPQTPTAPLQNTQGQKLSITPQQKIIASNGQVYVLSANGQELILQQPSTTSVTTIAPQLKPIPSQSAPSLVSTTPSVNGPSNASQQRTPQLLLAQNNSQTIGSMRQHQQKPPVIPSKMGFQAQKNVVSVAMQSDNKVYLKRSTEMISNDVDKVTSGKSSLQVEPKKSTAISLSTPISGVSTFTCSMQSNQTLTNQLKSQKITTLEGSFVKQEPLTAVIKQEPVVSIEQSSSFSISHSSASTTPSPMCTTVFQDISHAVTSGTSSSVGPVASSLVVSTAITGTVTTQSHQNTIMMTSPSVGNSAGACATTTSSASTTTKSSVRILLSWSGLKVILFFLYQFHKI